ncbi:MAG TPA: hypothetical protein VFW63_10640 [Acidimicrobiales bacterium]|nr:hypothetical protein [Acidimicrobiales bacterium]
MLGSAPHIPGCRDLSLIGERVARSLFSARSEATGRPVTVTVFAPLSGGRTWPDFDDAAATAQRLGAHPSVLTIHAWGLAPDGRPWVVTDPQPPASVATLLTMEGPLPVDRALQVGVLLAGALETAHRAGIVHGDLQPDRLVLGAYGEPLLVETGLTPFAVLPGLAALNDPVRYFAPPEVLERTGTSPATDVYSLATTVYALLAGRAPHQRPADVTDSNASLLLRILQLSVPPLDRPDLPPGLEEALRGFLAPDPAKRPQRAIEVAWSLQDVQRRAGLGITEPVVLDLALPAPPGAGRWQAAEPAAGAGGSRPAGAVGGEAPGGVLGDTWPTWAAPLAGLAATAAAAGEDVPPPPTMLRLPGGDAPPPATGSPLAARGGNEAAGPPVDPWTAGTGSPSDPPPDSPWSQLGGHRPTSAELWAGPADDPWSGRDAPRPWDGTDLPGEPGDPWADPAGTDVPGPQGATIPPAPADQSPRPGTSARPPSPGPSWPSPTEEGDPPPPWSATWPRAEEASSPPWSAGPPAGGEAPWSSSPPQGDDDGRSASDAAPADPGSGPRPHPPELDVLPAWYTDPLPNGAGSGGGHPANGHTPGDVRNGGAASGGSNGTASRGDRNGTVPASGNGDLPPARWDLGPLPVAPEGNGNSSPGTWGTDAANGNGSPGTWSHGVLPGAANGNGNGPSGTWDLHTAPGGWNGTPTPRRSDAGDDAPVDLPPPWRGRPPFPGDDLALADGRLPGAGDELRSLFGQVVGERPPLPSRPGRPADEVPPPNRPARFPGLDDTGGWPSLDDPAAPGARSDAEDVPAEELAPRPRPRQVVPAPERPGAPTRAGASLGPTALPVVVLVVVVILLALGAAWLVLTGEDEATPATERPRHPSAQTSAGPPGAPTAVEVTDVPQGAQVSWRGDAEARYVVTELSPTSPPRTLPPTLGTSLTVPSPGGGTTTGRCFTVAPAGTDGRPGPASDAVCTGGARPEDMAAG